MTTWRRGRELVTPAGAREGGPAGRRSSTCVHDRRTCRGCRAPRSSRTRRRTPPRSRCGPTPTHNRVLHESVVIVSAGPRNVPHVPPAERMTVDDLGYADDGVLHLTAEFGFSDVPDLPAALPRRRRGRAAAGEPTWPGRPTSSPAAACGARHLPGMARWRKVLFTALARNAADPAEVFNLPLTRTVMLGSQSSSCSGLGRTPRASHGACGSTLPVSISDLRLASTAGQPCASATVGPRLGRHVLVVHGQPDDLVVRLDRRTSPGMASPSGARSAEGDHQSLGGARLQHGAADIRDARSVGAHVLPGRTRAASPRRCCAPSTRGELRGGQARARPAPAWP